MKNNSVKLKTFKFLIVIFSFSLLIFNSTPVAAQVIGNLEFLKGIVPCGTSYASAPCTVCHFYKLLQNIINFLLLTSTSLVTLMAVYIGFLFLFSGGSPKRIEDAKSKLWLLVWGLVWVLGSWLVLSTIINSFTVIGKSSDFPMPWNQISCEVSKGGGNIGGGEIDFSDHIFDDVHIAVDTETDVVTVVDESEGRTTTFDLPTEGAGIGLVREDYSNVFIMGGDMSIQDAEKLKKSLDAAASMLPAGYNIKDKIIFVPIEKELNKNLFGAAGGFRGKGENIDGFISKNNVIILSDFANKFDEEENVTETIVHELAHVRANEIFRAFGGDSEWDGLYTGERHTVDKNGFIIGPTQASTGFVSNYAKTNASEDLAESIAKATLALNGKAKAYTGDSITDAVLQEKYEYLKKNGLIKDIPPR